VWTGFQNSFTNWFVGTFCHHSQGSVAIYCRCGGNRCGVYIENFRTNQLIKNFENLSTFAKVIIKHQPNIKWLTFLGHSVYMYSVFQKKTWTATINGITSPIYNVHWLFLAQRHLIQFNSPLTTIKFLNWLSICSCVVSINNSSDTWTADLGRLQTT